MDEQILKAVEIALSGTSDLGLKNQAFEFINQIKSTEEGYKSCLDILLKSINSNSPLNQEFKFFILQVIDENITKLNNEQLYELNSDLFQYLNYVINSNINDPVYLKNKFAGIMGNLFCFTYLSINPNFLKDLLALIADNNLIAIDIYSRIIIAVHTEISDKFISRSREVQDRNNLLKDQIRTNDMNLLVDNWQKILRNPELIQHNNDVLNNFLKIIGYYINWMEITLFISNDFINIIFQYLNKPDQRNETCLTLIEVISKKMKPLNKLELISLLNLTSIINSINNDDDLEFMENIAKLSNQVGLELVIVLESSELELFDSINQQFLNLWPSIFKFLSHEYDDISQQIFPFIQQYLLTCKKFNQLASIELLSSLLNKIILKMKFDDDDDGTDDESTEQFNEIRLKLKTFQDTIAILKPELFLEAIPIVINESVFANVSDFDKVNWRNLELGLFELNTFTESLRNNLINLPKQEIGNSKPYVLVQEFLIKLINSDLILKIDHPKIQLGFFELIVRHYNFLNTNINNQEVILRILELFSSPLGLFNNSEKVRLRTWYLFFRFVKLTKPTLNNSSFIENLFIKLQPLLVIKAELPTKDEDNDTVENGNFNNQLNLFESIGLLISLLSVDISLKVRMIDLIFQPLFNDLENCISNKDKVNQQLIALQAHHSLMAIGTFARGYDYDYNNKYSAEIVNKINNASQVVLITLENFAKFEIIRDAARFSFARFIPILNEEINNHLSKLVSIILAANNLRISELTNFLNFLGQIVHNFQSNDNIYQLLNDLLSPLLDKIFSLLKYNGENNEYESMPDIIRDKESLKKSYMNFISAIITNHSSSLLITETNKQKFPVILESFFVYAYNTSEPTVSKLAITQLINVVSVMGGHGGKINDPQDKYGESLPPLEGVDEYLMNKAVQLSFELPFQKLEFDLKDAQYRLVGQEIASLLKTYQEKRGDEYLTFLSNYLTNMGLSLELMTDFCTNLVKLDQRAFKKYFITFVTELKGK